MKHSCYCFRLQSCSLSPGQKIVLLHNPGPCTLTGRGDCNASQPASAPCCARASMRMKMRLRSQVCRGSSRTFNSYTRAANVDSSGTVEPPLLLLSFELGRRHDAKPPRSARLEQDETYASPSLHGAALEQRGTHTWVYVTCMMQPLPLG